MQVMPDLSVDALCELGQEQLIQTRYLEAEATLVRAEKLAQAANDWDSLSRLYMPLQEARRQRRQRCGEGIVCLDLLARGPDDVIDPAAVLEKYPGGQLLVAGWGTIEPAIRIRKLAAARQLYVEVFLAAVYGSGNSRIVLIAPEEDTPMPLKGGDPREFPMNNGLIFPEAELPRGAVKGTPQTYGRVMDIWERLHAPFLAAADNARGLTDKISGYRRTIRVDYACELAHQKLSAVARQLAREALA